METPMTAQVKNPIRFIAPHQMLVHCPQCLEPHAIPLVDGKERDVGPAGDLVCTKCGVSTPLYVTKIG